MSTFVTVRHWKFRVSFTTRNPKLRLKGSIHSYSTNTTSQFNWALKNPNPIVTNYRSLGKPIEGEALKIAKEVIEAAFHQSQPKKKPARRAPRLKVPVTRCRSCNCELLPLDRDQCWECRMEKRGLIPDVTNSAPGPQRNKMKAYA